LGYAARFSGDPHPRLALDGAEVAAMSEIRSFNDMRRSRFCRPGAERDKLVVCDLGTPWCLVAHDEDQETTILAAPSVAAEQCLQSILRELKNRSCSIDYIGLETEHERWVVRYRDRWNGPTMIYVHFPPEPTQKQSYWFDPDVVFVFTCSVLLLFGAVIALLASMP
jgi:hypothetical protein